MSGFDLGNWAMSIVTFAIHTCVAVLSRFLTAIPSLVGVIIGMFLCYTMIRVFVIRLIGGSMSSASDSVVHPKN